VGGVTGACACGWCVGTKDGRTPLGTIIISTEDGAYAAKTEEAADRRGNNGFKSMAT